MSTPNMRAKFSVTSVQPFPGGETITFNAVGKAHGYPADGSDEDNTFARYTPSASLQMTVMNPALLGQYKIGQVVYADFTPAE